MERISQFVFALYTVVSGRRKTRRSKAVSPEALESRMLLSATVVDTAETHDTETYQSEHHSVSTKKPDGSHDSSYSSSSSGIRHSNQVETQVFVDDHGPDGLSGTTTVVSSQNGTQIWESNSEGSNTSQHNGLWSSDWGVHHNEYTSDDLTITFVTDMFVSDDESVTRQTETLTIDNLEYSDVSDLTNWNTNGPGYYQSVQFHDSERVEARLTETESYTVTMRPDSITESGYTSTVDETTFSVSSSFSVYGHNDRGDYEYGDNTYDSWTDGTRTFDSWSQETLVPRINLDSFSSSPQYIIAGTLAEEPTATYVINTTNGTGNLEHLQIGVNGNVDSIDHLEIVVDGVVVAHATMNACDGYSDPAYGGTFCAHPAAGAVELNGEQTVEIYARIKRDAVGGVPGVFEIVINNSDGKALQVDAVGTRNSFQVPANRINFPTLISQPQEIVMALLDGVKNSHPAANGTAIPTGITPIGSFRFYAAAHSNTRNGSDDVSFRAEALVLSENIDISSMWTLDKSNPFPGAGTVSTVSVQEFPGGAIITFDVSEVDASSFVDVVVMADILNSQIDPSVGSFLQVSVDPSTIVWSTYDAITVSSSYVGIPGDVVYSTNFVSGARPFATPPSSGGSAGGSGGGARSFAVLDAAFSAPVPTGDWSGSSAGAPVPTVGRKVKSASTPRSTPMSFATTGMSAKVADGDDTLSLLDTLDEVLAREFSTV